MRKHWLLALFGLAASALTSCQEPSTHSPTAMVTQAQVAIAPPHSSAATPTELPGVHNIVAYAPGYFSGGVPDRTGLASLSAMGIRTIVSVDGAEPDVAAAEALGMRYVHLPIRYSGVATERELALAQALVTMPGPIYVHCHHGKHRSAAALASAGIVANLWTCSEVEARMKVSGTSQDYPGLWASVRQAKPQDRASLQVDPNTLPKVFRTSGTVALMTECDVAFDDVKAVHKAGWQPPKDHPDLVPTKVAQRMHDLFTKWSEEEETKRYPADLHEQLQRAIHIADDLKSALSTGDAVKAGAALDAMAKSCKECHKTYRDR
jgi:protein tyrosine phosphatase (PTP) superfamily phosphohydrolase (DUF442 family)